LALGKPTKQSTTHLIGVSSKAVDGNKNTNYTFEGCTHTKNSTGSWWQVDLGSVYEIRDVVITNRADCCGKFNVVCLFRTNSPYVYTNTIIKKGVYLNKNYGNYQVQVK